MEKTQAKYILIMDLRHSIPLINQYLLILELYFSFFPNNPMDRILALLMVTGFLDYKKRLIIFKTTNIYLSKSKV